MNFRAPDLPAMEEVAKQLIDLLPDDGIIVVEGEMGAGKTTLITQLCAALGVEDKVSSPTFSLVNEYRTSDDDLIFHFDLYRLEDPEEALDFGIEEYFDQGARCFIEWADRLGSYLPETHYVISIEDQEGTRSITFTKNQ
ncbi:tRNA (adenosine(37)-N6)-threonylcarbamoyltransferase complex ATPase subunit type 1 TsaE [Sanyastnella coralliicola]|uniref:tRNA (adenosine(37)-N6)-threonylcarbamoyltransferase complex ATPase subunit type 1 TsaE n=1 Tax=Sanyastnella coralliicola TaxID=3069118 RepID=UPI0027B8C459|nr:tRNA (adenosine(37)-N6)-threonylcarbamoyltransferase complex ATPase subunit type 1 TsaE [Longitalea sp. SCSIO 12813]